MQPLIETLRAIPLFAPVRDEHLQPLLGDFVLEEFAAGQDVAKEGEPGDTMYIIAQGEFQVLLRQEELDFEKELGRLQAGQYFGEIALLTGGRRIATVRAVVLSKAWLLKRDILLKLMESSPALALGLCQGLARIVMAANQEITALPFVQLKDFPQAAETHVLLPPRVSVLCQAIALARREQRVKVGLVNPADETVRAFIRNLLRPQQVEFVAISHKDFEKARSQWFDMLGTAALGKLDVGDLEFIGPEGVRPASDRTGDAVLLEKFLIQAVAAGASDIHLEPTSQGGQVRLRVDGLMFALPDQLSAKQHLQTITRLKILSDGDITVKRLPQDGHFALMLQQRRIDVRLSVVPCQGGEKAVLRLLDPAQRQPDLDALVQSRPLALMLRELFLSPSGLLLVCGPTGSGKTTTLYAGLNEIWRHSSTVNIVTIEDPVEYQIDFASQIGVNRAVGLEFEQILRTVLRQDPDVILVGEIRDSSSAAIALEAATTGHLVLSSLHTDFALEAIARLRHLGVRPYLLATALKGIVSQKLVTRVCKNCAGPIDPADPDIVRLQGMSILPTPWTRPLMRGKGCELCQFRGELGRVAVLELLVVRDRLRNLIEKGATAVEMQEALGPNDFIAMPRYARTLLEAHLVAPERIREIFPMQGFVAP